MSAVLTATQWKHAITSTDMMGQVCCLMDIKHAGLAGYFHAPAALACPWGQDTIIGLPDVTIVFCSVEGAVAMKVRPLNLNF